MARRQTARQRAAALRNLKKARAALKRQEAQRKSVFAEMRSEEKAIRSRIDRLYEDAKK